MDYRTPDECRYYGSDLNKFIDKETSHEKTVNNIDCVIYKRSLRRLRLIESKHSAEGSPRTQDEVLSQLKWLLNLANEMSPDLICDIFKVWGNAPYEDGVKVNDLISGKTIRLYTKQDLIKWIDFERDI